MKKILITGGAGFVGYHLAKKEIDNGNEVTIIDNFERPNLDKEFNDLISRENAIFLKKDVSKEKTFKDFLAKASEKKAPNDKRKAES